MSFNVGTIFGIGRSAPTRTTTFSVTHIDGPEGSVGRGLQQPGQAAPVASLEVYEDADTWFGLGDPDRASYPLTSEYQHENGIGYQQVSFRYDHSAIPRTVQLPGTRLSISATPFIFRSSAQGARPTTGHLIIASRLSSRDVISGLPESITEPVNRLYSVVNSMSRFALFGFVTLDA